MYISEKSSCQNSKTSYVIKQLKSDKEWDKITCLHLSYCLEIAIFTGTLLEKKCVHVYGLFADWFIATCYAK